MQSPESFRLIAELRFPSGEVLTAETKPREIVPGPAADPDRPSHATEFETVHWRGQVYALTPKQRVVIACLWQAWESGHPFVGGHYLLERADSEQSKMSYVFRGSPAWRTLIVPGELRGGPADTYCLAFARA